jgi:hypothetical protein
MSNYSENIAFSAIDYKNVDTLSSYALPITPLTFVLNADVGRHSKVVWDFGDGTTSKSVTASKYYEFPGIYNVNLVIYNCNNNAIVSTQTKSITIYDYIPYTFNIETHAYIISEDGNYIIDSNGNRLIAELDTLNLKCGKNNNELVVNSYYPRYQPVSNIFYDISGSSSNDYWDIKSNKFAHLENFHTLYDKTYNYSISSFQYTEISKIVPTTTELYAKIEDGQIISCKSSDSNSSFIGISGKSEIYLREDTITDKLLVKFWFDKTNSKLPINQNKNVNYLNNLGITLSAKIIDNNDISRLSVTSNGIDGEGYPISSFVISPIKFFNTKIPFVVKIKDNQNFSIKNFDKIPLSALSVTLSSDSGVLTNNVQYYLSSLNQTLSSQNSGGAFRGYVEFPKLENVNILENVSILVSGTFINNQSVSYTLSTISEKFNVYSQNYYDAYKINENFNPAQTLKDLRFQETLLDKTILFDDFLGSALGNEYSDHEAIGVKQYEKIANFVANTQDLDDCEYESIDSLGKFMGYSDNGEKQYIFPEKIKRVVNLASVDKSHLLGTSNKFKENLDIKGRSTKDEYGINIGDIIDANTYTVSAGVPIVALEKFSNNYNVLNTYQPVSAVGSNTYKLSSYNSNFGWPLVLPNDFTFADMSKFYIFFEYNDVIDGSIKDSLIDFENVKTTIDPNSTNYQLFGIFENMFTDTLYQSLSLIG